MGGQIAKWATGVGEMDAPARIVDVEKLVPFGAGQKALLWEKDGLHFSPAGSRQLGRGLASHVESLLKPSDQPPTIQLVQATGTQDCGACSPQGNMEEALATAPAAAPAPATTTT